MLGGAGARDGGLVLGNVFTAIMGRGSTTAEVVMSSILCARLVNSPRMSPVSSVEDGPSLVLSARLAWDMASCIVLGRMRSTALLKVE